MTFRQILPAALAALALGASVSACTAKESTSNTAAASKTGTEVAVDATDTGCNLSAKEAATGTTTFAVTNNGTKVTEFYVYGKDNQVLGEAENISPGLKRELAVEFKDAGPHTVACKPGMVGDGIRSDFTVKAG